MGVIYVETNNDPTKSIESVYAKHLREFKEQLALQEKKYPLSEREKLFADTLLAILQTADEVTCQTVLKKLI